MGINEFGELGRLGIDIRLDVWYDRVRLRGDSREDGMIYCEFCGRPVPGIKTPERFIKWTHNVCKDVVRCEDHRRASKLDRTCRSHNPMTGEHRGQFAGRFYPAMGEKE